MAVVLELFPCSGGLSEGFRRVGLPASMAFDYSADACESHERNQGLRPFQVDARDLLRMVLQGWSPGPIDLFVADPPCTPWSRAGKRLGEDDERDMLSVTVELVRALRPRAYLIANVPGLDDGPNLPIVQRTIGSLAAAGYCAGDFARLDAADFGVPQHRIRPFWFGHLEGPCLAWPARTHGSPAECAATTLPGLERLLPWVTCRAALGHLPPDELGKPLRLQWKTSSHPPSRLDEPGNVVPSSQPGNGGAVLVTGIDHPVSPDADGLARTIRATDGGTPDKIMTWPWERPSTVVASGDVIAPFGRSGQKGEHQRGNPNAIKLSEKAAAILQGFPEGWVFCGKTKAERWSQIGMAMPPPLAEVVARAVAAQMLAARAADGRPA